MAAADNRLETSAACPRLDLVERDTVFEILADLPGTQLGDVDVEFAQGTLTVQARVTAGRETYDVAESRVGVWHFVVAFGNLVDGDGIQAVYERGVLLVTLPKASGARRIAIGTN